MSGDVWRDKAEENVEEWGEQSFEQLLLASQEELGELTQAYLQSEYEEGSLEDLEEELNDLAALCVQIRWKLNKELKKYPEEDEEGSR